MAYRIVDKDTCRDGFESFCLFGADLDVFGLEIPVLVGRSLRIDMNHPHRYLAVVKRSAGRLCFPGDGERNSLLRLFIILREGLLLCFSHLLLVE